MPDVSTDDFKRLEDKLDKLAEGMTRLILIDERQVLQSGRMGALEGRVAEAEKANRDTDNRVTLWVQRGVGVWAAVVVAWSVMQAMHTPAPIPSAPAAVQQPQQPR